MIKFISGFMCGTLAMGFFANFLVNKELKKLQEVKVTQVSGEKITHSGFNYTKGTIKFTTEAEGKGVIITEIPKTNIPEAKSWIENNHGAMLELLLVDRRIYGASYMKRWNNFSVGGGILLSEKKFEGIKIQSQYWFNL